MWAKTSRYAVLLVALLLAGCGSSKQTTSNAAQSRHAAEYPAQWKEDYFRSNHCGTEDGDSTSSCECQIEYVETHVPYKDLEEGSSEHAKAEEVMNEAPSHCEAHTSSEETVHNNAAEAQQKIQELREQKEQAYQPEEEQLQKDKEKAEYEAGG